MAITAHNEGDAMRTMYMRGRTAADGTLTLSVPVGSPETDCEAVVVFAQPDRTPCDFSPGATRREWRAAVDAFRERLRASGRTFGDSVAEFREDRDR